MNSSFSPIDCLAADTMANALSEINLKPFLSYLAASFRQGYLCVEEREGKLFPAPVALLEEPIDDTLNEIIHRGFTQMRADTGTDMGSDTGTDSRVDTGADTGSDSRADTGADSPYVVRDGNRLYLQRAWHLLNQTDALYKQVAAYPPKLAIDATKLDEALRPLEQENVLLPEQAAAIGHSLQKSLSYIWGGPGTGKTYTAGWLVKLLLEQQPQAKIALTAPTGKAAANLKASIRRVTGNTARIDTKTLHALLSLRKLGQRPKTEMLAYDLIIVDESSMIDLDLASKLLARIEAGTRLIFLGDPYQLPPVEPGEPFCAFVAAAEAKSSAGKLVTSKRQEHGAILELAALVREARVDQALDFLENSGLSCVAFVEQGDASFSTSEHVNPLDTPSSSDIKELFKTLNKKRLISPLREGHFGTKALNALIEKKTRRGSMQPIIITQNDYPLALMNGQVGILHGTTSYFEDFENPDLIRAIPTVLLTSYEFAHCLSVHKSQGSEFDEVVLFLPAGSERFGRKMLYTAITRAKKKLTIIGQQMTLRACIAHEGRPCTTFLQLS